jgi:hypothetical protein
MDIDRPDVGAALAADPVGPARIGHVVIGDVRRRRQGVLTRDVRPDGAAVPH